MIDEIFNKTQTRLTKKGFFVYRLDENKIGISIIKLDGLDSKTNTLYTYGNCIDTIKIVGDNLHSENISIYCTLGELEETIILKNTDSIEKIVRVITKKAVMNRDSFINNNIKLIDDHISYLIKLKESYQGYDNKIRLGTKFKVKDRKENV